MRRQKVRNNASRFLDEVETLRAAQEARLKFVIKISCGILPADNVADELQRGWLTTARPGKRFNCYVIACHYPPMIDTTCFIAVASPR